MNNYKRIKNMNIDEMAEYLSNRAGCAFCIYEFEQDCNQEVGCVGSIKQWLEQECD
jgi:hypothetical protein